MTGGRAGDRYDRIAEWLEREGRIDVARTADLLGVAPETVRRDLRAMEDAGRLHRVHGGAIPLLPQPVAGPAAEDGRYGDIGRRLWQRLPREGTLLIGAGAPTAGLADAICSDPPDRPGLTIVTNSLDAAIALSRCPNLPVYNIGGTVHPDSHSQQGDWAVSELNRLRVDVSVVCAAGVSVTDGLTDSSPTGAAVCRAQVTVGRRVIAVSEAGCVGAAAFVRFATIDEIDELAVAGPVEAKLLQPFVDRGLPLTIADGAAR